MKIKDNVLIVTSIAEDVSGIEAIKSEFEKNHKDYNVVVIDERQYGAEKAATRRTKNRERLIQSIPTFYRRVKTVGHVFTVKSKIKSTDVARFQTSSAAVQGRFITPFCALRPTSSSLRRRDLCTKP